MDIKGLGRLTPDDHFDDWFESAPVSVPLALDRKLEFVVRGFADDPAPDQFVAAIGRFLTLGAETRKYAAPYVFRNYENFMGDIDPPPDDVLIAGPADVWDHVRPTYVSVCRHKGTVYVTLKAECDWEEEHGLQLVFRHGHQLSRVSAQDGHLRHCDAYGVPESEDRIN